MVLVISIQINDNTPRINTTANMLIRDQVTVSLTPSPV